MLLWVWTFSRLLGELHEIPWDKVTGPRTRTPTPTLTPTLTPTPTPTPTLTLTLTLTNPNPNPNKVAKDGLGEGLRLYIRDNWNKVAPT